MMKVLFVTRKWPPAVGGMETYSRDLTEELRKLTDLEVVALPGRPDGSPPGLLVLALFLARTAFLLLRRGRNWDLVHFGDFVLFPLAWIHSKVAPEIPRLITVHGLDIIFGNRSDWKAGPYRAFMAWAKRRRSCLNKVIVNSRYTGRLVRMAGLGESIVIPLGVAVKHLSDLQVQPIRPGEPYVLFVGRLVHRKGAAWFAKEVLPRLPIEVRFKVVGKTWDEAEAEVLRESSRVDHLGYVSDEELTRLRASSIAVVMPNVPSDADKDVEGFGIVALEAAVGGAPLVAADLEGISDAVIEGVTGFLIEPMNAGLWEEKIRSLLEWDLDQRRSFARAARSRVLSDYSWSRVASDTLHVYRRALSETLNP